ncbi:unnamed protein product (macronuclear) [Paramecium tetraurelia]|uniref:Uncharacterized protein n=1 Tax=Paramecium tetraurelia TaxID=5888 RepID=A0BHK8_PARTE|nr:uncharacterized protein GSPATT00029060001 [Paramecium tetraurelia]CAK58025.1 unnamed protein product [Paramecium tetraurelia]|eukprot:XP_001425423.1 hypothetical protein (macronuclear) [Paramecium tetraurelia strain d4-2]
MQIQNINRLRNKTYRQQSVGYQENIQQSINKTKSSQSISRMKYNANKSVLTSQSQLSQSVNFNSVSMFVRVLNNSTKKHILLQKQQLFDQIRKQIHYKILLKQLQLENKQYLFNQDSKN